MFPLGSVLLPGSILPLHVFEPRYRQLVIDVLADDARPPEFGVVMIERGWEVGGGDERTGVGTLARVTDVQALDDGRYAVVALGVQRLRVVNWLPDDPYPSAEVALLDDDVDPDHRSRLESRLATLRERIDDLNEQARVLGDTTPGSDVEISDDPSIASFHLMALAPVGDADRHRLLCIDGIDERLDELNLALDDAAAVLEFRRT